VNFALINQSTEKTLTDDVLTTIARTVSTQVAKDYCPAWQTAPSVMYVVASEAQAAKGDCVVALLDNADQAGALGYHDTTPQGRPYARIFVATIMSNQGTLTTGPNSVSVCVSHEVLEALGDPYCNGYSDNSDGSTQFCQELCDPVESSAYVIDGVSVSDFLLPCWFDPSDKTGPWDKLGVLEGPMTVAQDGYVISRAPGAQAQATFGETYPIWKIATKQAEGSRTNKRTRKPVDDPSGHFLVAPTHPPPAAP
jgi:hypothetical protein